MDQVAAAREEYARRRTELRAELAARGVHASADDGINLWLAVADQQAAMLSLAAHGSRWPPVRRSRWRR